MTDAINNNNRVKAPSPATDQRAKSSSQSGENPQTASTGPASTVVELSSSQMMKEMERLPEINSSKVEAIKTALANGEYQPDPEVIARKFSEIEKLLP